MKTEQDLEQDILFPTEKSVQIKGETFVIKPFTIKQTSLVIKRAGDLIPLLVQLVNEKNNSNVDIIKIIALLEGGIDTLIEIISIVLGCKQETIEELNNDEFLRLCETIYTINHDFFENTLKKTLDRVLNNK